jgi:hypothetical protein
MDELARELLPVVADPNQLAQLYNHLRAFCHDIRNDLSLYRMQIYLARRTASPEQLVVLNAIEARYVELESFVLRVQTICRPMNPMRMRVSLDLLVTERGRSWFEQFAAAGRTLRIVPPGREVEGDFDPTLLGDALDAFVHWRAGAGAEAGTASVRWNTEQGRIRMVWHEPGSIHPFRASGRLPCLSLALLGRVLAAHGGTLRVEEQQGFRLELYLPCDEPKPLGSQKRADFGECTLTGPASRGASPHLRSRAQDSDPRRPSPGAA